MLYIISCKLIKVWKLEGIASKQQVPQHTVAPDVLTCANQEHSSIRYFYPWFPSPALFFS